MTLKTWRARHSDILVSVHTMSLVEMTREPKTGPRDIQRARPNTTREIHHAFASYEYLPAGVEIRQTQCQDHAESHQSRVEQVQNTKGL